MKYDVVYADGKEPLERLLSSTEFIQKYELVQVLQFHNRFDFTLLVKLRGIF